MPVLGIVEGWKSPPLYFGDRSWGLLRSARNDIKYGCVIARSDSDVAISTLGLGKTILGIASYRSR
jgi:hypothetical protein